MKSSEKKKIYLIDLAHESELGLSSDTMPLQLGLIGSYCLKQYGSKVDIKIFKFVEDFKEAMDNEIPFIIGASNYLWNIDLNYKFISVIKEKYPKVITIFGGPNYPDELKKQIEWLAKYKNIDFYIFKDGEIAFSNLVGTLLESSDVRSVKKTKLSSCHCLIEKKYYFGDLEPRITDLSTIPSPYIAGLMDHFFDHRLVPTIQTSRGCPFECAYCSEGDGYYSQISKKSLELKKAEVDYIVDKVKHTKNLRITDSNFGMYKEDVEFCAYLSKIQKRVGYPEYLGCSTGKNQHKRVLECNRLLGGVIRFTASVQSLVPDVLENVGRKNISIADMIALSDEVSDKGTNSYSEVILALPGDSLAGEMQSMEGLMNAGISNITQHQFALIYGTSLNLEKNRKFFGMKGMFRPIQRCIGKYSFMNKEFISIEIEEICIENNTLSFEDYLKARQLYLSVGMFYNDRIFGEIHALLRLLNLSTWKWVNLVHESIKNSNTEIEKLYDDFARDTSNELWDNPEKMFEDVSTDIERYVSGEIGGNLIYKYRALGFIKHFSSLHKIAFENLRLYLRRNRIECNSMIENLHRFSWLQKHNLLNHEDAVIKTFDYDIVRMITDPTIFRKGGSIEDVHKQIDVKIYHTKEQEESIKRQLDFYGSHLGGLTMLLSRFPVKRFYRETTPV
jgi:radical SAM superfamily enzyme YgiQ (UPF0313 family)|tara:strand:- start:16536 stop:18557 length:2022 start_codon:yes stop_codon:yes gene_type:complete